MAMPRTSTSFTPCPAPVKMSGRRRTSVINFQSNVFDEPTTDIDYTRALEPTLRGGKARRSSLFVDRVPKRAPATILEDLKENEEPPTTQVRLKPQGKTLLSKPARKMAMRGGNGGGGLAAGGREMGLANGSATNANTATQHDSIAPTWELCDGQMADGRPVHGKMGLHTTTRANFGAEARRRGTIYIPEDTTIVSIHPGAGTTNRLDDTFYLGNPEVPPAQQQQGEAANEAADASIPKPRRGPRKSLAAAPKRVPFLELTGFGNTESFDVCGANTGKENIPPGAYEKKFKLALGNPLEADMVRDATAMASFARPHVRPRPQPKGNCRSSLSTGSNRPGITFTAPLYQKSEQHPAAITKNRLSSQASKVKKYPVLNDDLPARLYSSNSWLGDEEVAITEIINEIFTAARPVSENTSKSTRDQMLDLYRHPEVAILLQRLSASLAYGSLSIPKTMYKPPNPGQDIRLRKDFLTLFLHTYHEDVLRTAAELVVGRQIPETSTTPIIGRDTTHLVDPAVDRRLLIEFLETFFVYASDADYTAAFANPDHDSLDVIRWRKIMQRSLMLVWLLDHTKLCAKTGCGLFKRTSSHRSSTDVLQTLSKMFLPFVGDVTRCLTQLNFEVSYVQDPLDFVNYHIDRISVDLRDGVILTHLVEILLSSHDTLCSSRVLSEKLKWSDGHATLIYNVQIALCALESQSKDTANIARSVTAADIVDGHREKTLGLLWSLVNNLGLIHLVDWKELAIDIMRLQNDSYTVNAFSPPPSDCEGREALLLTWASAYVVRNGGSPIFNLTTAFADRKPFVAIIDGFRAFISRPNEDPHGDPATQFSNQLKALKCSDAFIEQLTSVMGIIPSHNTTLSNLAFLASRLLPLSKRYRAATKIQKWYRSKLAWSRLSQRIQKQHTNRDRANMVQITQRRIAAVTVIQRAWRAVLASRLNELEVEVATLQSMARGFVIRNGALDALIASGHARSVVAGW